MTPDDCCEPAAFWQAELGTVPAIPVSRPRLPEADDILPYLRRIDATRWYTNGGPLAKAFEARLEAHFAVRRVVCAANATLGLALALMAQQPARDSLCMLPAWTFAASAHAVRLAGLTPWLVDVDPLSQELTPAMARDLLRRAPGIVGAIMPVVPFGCPTDMAGWDDFRAETGLAVVIDGAGAFDTARPGAVPCVVSLHATKVIGVGEGAFVASNDSTLIDRIVQAANFGFWNSREATVSAMNGKLSEYAAAVGLAALDRWPGARADYLRVGRDYARRLQGSGVEMPPGFGEAWTSSTLMVRLPDGGADLDATVGALHRAGIGVRCWWGGGLHRHAAFAGFPRTALPATDALARTMLGLPCWPDLSAEGVARVCEALLGTSA